MKKFIFFFLNAIIFSRKRDIMGLLDFLKELTQDDKDKKINDKLFQDEVDALGLTKKQMEDAKKVIYLLKSGWRLMNQTIIKS